jgi:hypothetical protein
MEQITTGSESFSTGTITTTGSINWNPSLFLDAPIKTPEVIHVLRGASQKAICIDTFDADQLPVTRCQTLATIGVPPELPAMVTTMADTLLLAGLIIIGIFGNIAMTVIVGRRKAG